MTFVVGKFITKIQAINTQNEELGFTQLEFIILKRTSKTITIISKKDDEEVEKRCRIFFFT